MLLLFQEWYLITELPSYLRKGDLKLRKTVEIPNCDTNCGNSISSRSSSSFSSSISTSISSTISNSISNVISSSISSSFSSSPPLTELLCQRVVFSNILSANNLQRLHKEMLSIHVLSFLFFCLFVRPSACLAVFLFFMLLLFQEWYLITKLPSYLRKGDLKLRKTVEIPNCDTNCGNSMSSSISSRISSSISTSISSSMSNSVSSSISSTISNSISNIISNSISSSFSSIPPLTKLLCQRVVFRNILSANNLRRLHKEMLSIHVLFFCFSVSLSVRLPVSLYFFFSCCFFFKNGT